MIRFEDLQHRPFLDLLHYLMPCKGIKESYAHCFDDPRWVERMEESIKPWYEKCTYTSTLTITKNVNFSWPMPYRGSGREDKIMGDQLLPNRMEFLARVQWLILDVTIDLNGLSNDAKVIEIKKELAPFTGLKQADVTVKVQNFKQACEDETQWRVEFFLERYAERHNCDIYLQWVESGDAYFPGTWKEKVAIDFAMDPRLGLTKIEDLNKAFRCCFYGRPFHG